MKVLFLAIALLNAPADEQKLMLNDLYAVDPALAVDVLDTADGLSIVLHDEQSSARGTSTDGLSIVLHDEQPSARGTSTDGLSIVLHDEQPSACGTSTDGLSIVLHRPTQQTERRR